MIRGLAPDNFYASSIGADLRVSLAATLAEKLLFLATNLPYWMIFFALVARAAVDRETIDDSVCGAFVGPLAPILAFFVAFSSSLMHFGQMRLGHDCGCCARDHHFHKTPAQKRMKKFDVACASSAALVGVACHDPIVFVRFLACVPFFVAGVLLKRSGYDRTYLVAHGAWHLATSKVFYDVLLS